MVTLTDLTEAIKELKVEPATSAKIQTTRPGIVLSRAVISVVGSYSVRLRTMWRFTTIRLLPEK